MRSPAFHGLHASAKSGQRRRSFVPRRQLRAQNELAFETAGFETAMCVHDLIKGYPRGDVWVDGAGRQQLEPPPEIFLEPGRVPRPHRVDRIELDTLAAGQPPGS